MIPNHKRKIAELQNEEALWQEFLMQKRPPQVKPKKATKKKGKPLSDAEKEAFMIFWASLIIFCALYYYVKMGK